MGKKSAKMPDYTAQITANGLYAKQAADEDLAFRREQFAKEEPRTQGLYDMGMRVANEQLADSATSRDRSAQQWQQYNDTFVPLEEKMASEAMAYGGEADQNDQAGRATVDARRQTDIARQMSARAMASMGINPNSGRFAGMTRGNDLSSAAMSAGAATNARTMARDKGIGLRAGAAAFGRNQVNTAGQMTGLATAAGSAGMGSNNMGTQGGLGWANFATGGTGNAINAANVSNNGYASLNQANAAAAQNSGGGLGALIGAGAQLGSAAILARSDRRLKMNIVPVGFDEATQLKLYEFNYKAHPDRTYIGVMADEVVGRFPEAVSYDENGFARVNYGLLGLKMQEVSHALD